MSLQTELAKTKSKIYKRIPKFVANYMDKLTQLLKDGGYESKPLSVGDVFPNGVFINYKGDEVILSDYLAHHKAIISFYRGAWCPYCNLELRAYDQLLNDSSNTDITMIAISPEQADQTMKSIDIEQLNFTCLSDKNNVFAKKSGPSI